MSKDANSRVQDLFLAALQIPDADRDAWLVEQCNEDPQLLKDVRSLLDHDGPDNDPLEKGLGKGILSEAGLVRNECGLHVRCPHCHNPIELIDGQQLDEIDCASCGSSFSIISTEETHTHQSSIDEKIAHFRLLEKVGVGAFGSVYRAIDQSLDRTVAIKVPRKGQLTSEETEKFIREARTAAQLLHPSIVSVHEVGRQDDQVYIVSDFIDGLTLSDWLTGRHPTARESAELVVKLGRALHHAHENGVIHRDLKPGNIMLDRDNEPHLMDFGLAKREAGEITMTMDGQVLGTPAYISPEQAKGEGHHVDRRADIYSLGVILFEMLTGERPFRGSERMLLHQAITEDAPSPRKLNQAIPKDLETICSKCLEKSPDKRYATAADLTFDLQQYLEHKPIQARPVTRFERGWRWCKRKPVIAGLSALLLMTLVIGTVVSSLFAMDARQQAIRAERLTQQERRSRLQALGEKERTRKALYRSDMHLAGNAYSTQRFSRLKTLLKRHQPGPGEQDLRGFVWNCLWNLAHLHTHELDVLGESVSQLKVSPDGRLLAAIGTDERIYLLKMDSKALIGTLDPPTGSAKVTSFAWSPDSRRLAAGHYFTGSCVRIWDIDRRTILKTIPQNGTTITAIAWSPDQQWLAWGTRKRKLCMLNLELDEIDEQSMPFASEARSLCFSPNSTLLAITGSRQKTLDVLDVITKEVAHSFNTHQGYFQQVAFDAAGRLLTDVTGTNPPQIRRMTFGTTQQAEVWPIWVDPIIKDGGVTSFAISKDGSRIAVGYWHGQVRLLNGVTGKLMGYLPGHASIVHSLSFSADGRELISASADHTVKVWDLSASRQPSIAVSADGWNSKFLATSPSGAHLATVDEDRIVVFDEATHQKSLEIDAMLPGISRVAFSEDGRRLVAGGTEGQVRVWDALSGELSVSIVADHRQRQHSASFSRDGKLIAAGGEGGIIDIWDGSGKHQCSIDTGSRSRVQDLVFIGNSKTLISSSADSSIRVWDVNSQRLTRTLDGHDLYNIRLDVPKSEKWLASSSWDKTVRIWNVDSGNCSRVFHCTRAGIKDIAISPDETLIAVAGSRQGIVLIDAETGEPLVNLDVNSPIRNLGFSSDGKTLYSGHEDGLIRIWNGADGHDPVGDE